MQILWQMSFEKLLCKEQYLEINIYLQQCTETIKAAYNQQRNKCVSILRKSKRSYFECLDVKFVKITFSPIVWNSLELC